MNETDLFSIEGGLDNCTNAIIGSAFGAVGIPFVSLPIGGPFSVAGFVASYGGFMWSVTGLGECGK